MKEKHRKLDRFVLSSKEMTKLHEAANKVFPNVISWENIFTNVSIPSFAVESDDGVYYVFINHGDELAIHFGNSNKEHFEYLVVKAPDNNGRVAFKAVNIGEFWLQHAFTDNGHMFLDRLVRIYAVLNYMSLERPEVFTYGERMVNVPKTIKKDGRFKEVRTTKMIRVIQLDSEEFAKRHNIVTCPCWGVAGHYRHYKNGKTVFIKSYRKGKHRDDPGAYQPKTYEL